MSFNSQVDTEVDEYLFGLFQNWCVHHGVEPTIAEFVNWKKEQEYDED